MLLASGEKLGDSTTVTRFSILRKYGRSTSVRIPEYLKTSRFTISLKEVCREAIIRHLIEINPHEHFFDRVPRLGLPHLVSSYLLYDLELKDDDDDDEEEEEEEGVWRDSYLPVLELEFRNCF